jgi:hypothetical protein
MLVLLLLVGSSDGMLGNLHPDMLVILTPSTVCFAVSYAARALLHGIHLTRSMISR